MSEALFVLTIIFVAYVVYVAVDEHKTQSKSAASKSIAEAPEVLSKHQTPETIPNKPTTVKPATAKKAIPISTTQNTAIKGLRDPKSGEVATHYSNYRFTKRWIKEALVAEGLLDKIYKNNELDATIEATIKDAIVKLEAMDKYKS